MLNVKSLFRTETKLSQHSVKGESDMLSGENEEHVEKAVGKRSTFKLLDR